MMQTLAAPGQEPPDTTVRVKGLQQLDLALTGREQHGTDTLVGDFGLLEQRQAEGVAIEATRFAEMLHHDPDVMDPSNHARSSSADKGSGPALASIANPDPVVGEHGVGKSVRRKVVEGERLVARRQGATSHRTFEAHVDVVPDGPVRVANDLS